MTKKSTTELLLEEMGKQTTAYNATMRAISHTDQNLSATVSKVQAIADKLDNIPEDCISRKFEVSELEKRVSENEKVATRFETKQLVIEKKVFSLEQQKAKINLKTMDGWRKVIPYVILGGLSLWGLISEALKAFFE